MLNLILNSELEYNSSFSNSEQLLRFSSTLVAAAELIIKFFNFLQYDNPSWEKLSPSLGTEISNSSNLVKYFSASIFCTDEAVE